MRNLLNRAIGNLQPREPSTLPAAGADEAWIPPGMPPMSKARPSRRATPPASGKGSGWGAKGSKSSSWYDCPQDEYDSVTDPYTWNPNFTTGRREGKGGRGPANRLDSRIFCQGQAAWQWLSHEDYMVLKRSHKWRLDKWSRDTNISWACTLLLRHAEQPRAQAGNAEA